MLQGGRGNPYNYYPPAFARISITALANGHGHRHVHSLIPHESERGHCCEIEGLLQSLLLFSFEKF